jgi:hypothetical protein
MKLFAPTVYFSDTIFAAPPYECYDDHPLTLAGIEHKQKLCDYLSRQWDFWERRGARVGRRMPITSKD